MANKNIIGILDAIRELSSEDINGMIYNIDEDKIRDSKSLITMNIKESNQMDFFIQTKIIQSKRRIIKDQIIL